MKKCKEESERKDMKKVASWKELTLREKIGQTVICLCESEKHVEMCGSVESFLQKYPIGGIFNNGGIVKGLLTGANLQFKNILEEYNRYLRVPLVGAADWGTFAAGKGITMIPQMALGATDNEDLAYAVGEFIAEDCRLSGVHWAFWPVCDLNISDRSPVTDTRSVSDNADLCYKIVKAEIQAMKDKGIIATLKHFPGTPYNETLDPHLTPINNETPIDVWRENYGQLYKRLFANKVPAVMTGHVNLVDYQEEQIDGVYPPATMSYELTTKLLREELGFQGVTVTDALVMGGFSGNKAMENTIRSFLSGNDVLLWPAYEYIDVMEQKILAGEIEEKLLDAAVERIWNMKVEYGIISNEDTQIKERPLEDAAFFEERAHRAAEKCLTLVSDENHILPMNRKDVKNVLIVGVTPDDGQYAELCALKAEFEKYGCEVTMRRNIWTEDVEKAAGEKDLILFALCRTTHRPIGPLDFWGEEATSIWSSNCSDRTKTVVVSFGTPYLYKYYKTSKMTYVNAYSCSRYVLSGFVRALFGDVPFAGKSSVKL